MSTGIMYEKILLKVSMKYFLLPDHQLAENLIPIFGFS